MFYDDDNRRETRNLSEYYNSTDRPHTVQKHCVET